MAEGEVVFESHSVEQTLELGRRLGAALRPGMVVALVGTLGSGKTHFVKGVARGNGTPANVIVNSPTFVIVNEYPGRLELQHIDAYRLHGAGELSDIGFEEMVAGEGAVLVEWADRVEEILPDDHLHIDIEVVGETDRQFTFRATGPTAAEILAAM